MLSLNYNYEGKSGVMGKYADYLVYTIYLNHEEDIQEILVPPDATDKELERLVLDAYVNYCQNWELKRARRLKIEEFNP